MKDKHLTVKKAVGVGQGLASDVGGFSFSHLFVTPHDGKMEILWKHLKV